MKLNYGIVNYEEYKGKIMILMKEANLSDDNGYVEVDSLNWLKRYISNDLNGKDSIQRKAKVAATKISRIAYIGEQILGCNGKMSEEEKEQIELDARKYIGNKDNHILNRIAFSNVKDEDCGGRTSNNKQLLDWIKKDNNIEQLKDRIESCIVNSNILYVLIGGPKNYFNELVKLIGNINNVKFISINHYSVVSYKQVINNISEAI